MKEIFNIVLTVEVDTESGDSKVIKKEIVKDVEVKKTAKKSSKKSIKEEDTTPKLTLTDNKYILNEAAVELLGAEADSRLDIKYHKVENSLVPIIGLDESFGTHGGNRLTKTGTVSCRGNANSQLARYGEVFTFEPYKDNLFLLKGDKDTDDIEEKEVPDDINLNLEGLVDEVEEKDEDELLNIDFNLN